MSKIKLVINDATTIGDIAASLNFEELIECISELADLEHKVNRFPKKVFGNYIAVYLKEILNIEVKPSSFVTGTASYLDKSTKTHAYNWHGTVIDEIIVIFLDLKLIGIEKVSIDFGGMTRMVDHYTILHRRTA